MKRMVILSAVVLVGCLAAGLYAQDRVQVYTTLAPGAAATANGAPSGGGFAGGAAISGAQGVILNSAPGGAFSRYGQMVKVCNLSEDQQNEIKAIEAERDKDTQAFNADNAEAVRAAMAAIGLAHETKDKDALQKAMTNYQQMMAPLGEIQKFAHAMVMGVLTPEQKATWQEFQVFNNIKAMFSRAKLTDEQMAQAKAVYADLAKDKDAKVEDIIRKMNEVVRVTLTDEQKEAMKPQAWINGANVLPGATLKSGVPPGAPINPAPGQSSRFGVQQEAPAGGVYVIQEGGNGGRATVTVHVEGAEK